VVNSAKSNFFELNSQELEIKYKFYKQVYNLNVAEPNWIYWLVSTGLKEDWNRPYY